MAIKNETEYASARLSLIRSAQAGDQDSFEALLNQYAPLIDSMVYRHGEAQGLSAQDCEDLRQEAVLAFYRALMRYDVTQTEVQFGLFAKLCIKNALYSHLRKLRHQQPLLLCLHSRPRKRSRKSRGGARKLYGAFAADPQCAFRVRVPNLVALSFGKNRKGDCIAFGP